MEYYKEANRFLQKYGSDAFKIIAAYEVAADISRTERYADWYGDYGIFEPSLNEDMTYDKLLSRYKVGLKYLGIIHEQTKAVCGNFLSEQLAEQKSYRRLSSRSRLRLPARYHWLSDASDR